MMSWPPRRARVSAALAGALVMVSLGSGWGFATAAAATPHRALVVVETGGTRYVRVITFTEDSVSGIRALELAGANPVVYTYSGQGGAVCRLFGVGRDAGPNCLGGADGDSRYWAYFRAPSGTSAFTYSRGGAGSVQVRDGDVEGWRFGTGQAPAYEALPPVTTSTTAAPTTTTSAAAGPGGGGGGPGAGGPSPGQNPTAAASGSGSVGLAPGAGAVPAGPTGDSPGGTGLGDPAASAGAEVLGRTETRTREIAAGTGRPAVIDLPVTDPGGSSATGVLIGFGPAIALLLGLALYMRHLRRRPIP